MSKGEALRKCGERVLFSLDDQTSNNVQRLSELVQRGREPFKLDKVDWLCSIGHTVKGVAEGKAKPCEEGECDQTFDNKIADFLTRLFRELAMD